MDQTIETHNSFEYGYLFWLVWENNVRKLGCDLYMHVLPMAIKVNREVMCAANVLDLQSQIYLCPRLCVSMWDLRCFRQHRVQLIL
jgi:hypothetical protein